MACLSFPVQLWRFLLTPTWRPTPLKGRTGCSETALLHLRPWCTQAPLDATFHSSGWSVVHGLIHLLQPLNSLPPCFHFYISRVWADRGGSFFFFFLNDISLVGKNLWWLLHLNGNLSRPTETWLPPGEHPERKWERLWIGVSRWKGLCTVCAATLCLQMQITGGEAHKPFYILLLKNLFSYTLPFFSAPASPRCHR